MKLIITNAVILDGTRNMVPTYGKTVIVEDGVIRAIVDTDKLSRAEREELKAGGKVMNLRGSYLMPGLINLHVHLALSGKPPKAEAKTKPVDYRKIYETVSRIKPLLKFFRNKTAGYAKTHLLSGTTTIRTVGGIMDFDSYVRDQINAGALVGPRILCSNTAVSVPGGHFAGSLGTETASPEEAKADVARIAQTNPDLIKLMVTGGVMDCEVIGEPGMLKMQPGIVKAACEEAHSRGFQVAAHVESPEGVRVALENGVDTIEHGARLTPELLKLFKETGAAQISTISPAIPYAIFDRDVSNCTEEAQINGRALLESMLDCTRTCLENDIPVGMGTDASCPFTTHYNMWRELVYFQRYMEVSSAFALYTATLGNAKIAGIDYETGSIEVGKSADFIVTRENPLDDLRVLRNIRMVIMRGKVYDRPHVKKMNNVDEALDNVEP